MSVEELLKPRYKVIGYYPHSPFIIGEILTQEIVPPYTDGNGYYELILYTNGTYSEDEGDVKESTAIFQPVQWWEERKVEDLPKYVRLKIDVPYYGIKKGEVHELKKIHQKSIEYWCADLVGFPMINAMVIDPATEQEYIDYTNQTDKK